jgi:hypothetical protein
LNFYITFRKNSVLAGNFVKIEADNIDTATARANAIFKNVDMVYYADKFDRPELKQFETNN